MSNGPAKGKPPEIGDGFASSSLARAADHFAAKDAEPEDKAELWGRRIGRALSAIGVIVLAFMLGRQLGWW